MDIQALVNNHQPEHSLERSFYTHDSIYKLDLEKIWARYWVWVGHESQVANIGDFFNFEFGQESVIVVRDSSHSIRAHVNVCRHRGSRVCIKEKGNTRSFTCPYHAWTYDLNGQLRAGRQMPSNFDRSNYGLYAAHLINFQGLLFVSLADNPPALDKPLEQLTAQTKAFEFESLKIAHTASYPVPANWKLALENYMECYHCAPAHIEYSRSHSLKDPDSMSTGLLDAMRQKARATGVSTVELDKTGASAETPGADVYYRRYPLYPGYLTGSKSGQAVAPLLGKLTDFDGGASDVQIGPLNNFLAYSDHLVGYRFIPRGIQQTDIQTVWMVDKNAVEGVDYELDNLTWLWHVTTLDDERIIRHNQAGVNSVRYQPGPLSSMEWGIAGLHHNYLASLAIP